MKISASFNKNFINHILVFLLIANSGLPFFTNKPYILVLSMFFTMLFIHSFKVFTNKHFLITIVFLSILIVGQTISVKLFDSYTTVTLFVRWIYPFVVLAAVRQKFPQLFINVMYFLTIVSFILFIPSFIFPEYNTLLFSLSKYFEQESWSNFYSYNSNILIYTLPSDSFIEGITVLKRNSGPFWEPGGFASYLILALLISVTTGNKIFNKKNVIFLIAIISTYSTPALIALSFLLLGYGIYIVRNKFVHIFWPLIIILVSYQAFSKLNFASERILRSITYYEERESAKYEKRDRMVSAIVDIGTFANYPIFGTGREAKGRFGSNTFGEMQHRNNGLTDFLVKYGIVFFIYYFYMTRRTLIYLSSQYIHKKEIWGNVALIVILIIGFSQILFQMSTFIAFFYCSIFIPQYRYLEKEI
jgi:hypothetical protein